MTDKKASSAPPSEKEIDLLLPEISKLVSFGFYSIVPLVALFIVFGILANSLTVFSIAIDYGLSFLVQFYAYLSIRAIQKSNVIRFPYGTGKLENFSGFLYGALSIPTGFYILYLAAFRFMLPPEHISFTVAQIPLLPSLARSLYLFFRSRKLMKKADSPLVHSYYVNFRISTMFDSAIIVTVTVGWVLETLGYGLAAWYLDPSVTVVLALYLLLTGIKLTIQNFRVLMDLPLPENEQLMIMKILASEFNNYSNVGKIYSRRSGTTRFIEIELLMPPDATLGKIEEMKTRMQTRFREALGDVKFNLIPLQDS